MNTCINIITTLAYRPFLDPIPLDGYWMLMLLPIALAISIIYKCTKLKDLSQLPRQAATMTVQIVVFMAAAAAVIWTITEVIL